MEFLQEPTFTALLALILSLIVAKIISVAVSNSTNAFVSSVNKGPVAKEATFDRGFSVKSSKRQKRVKFGDDVVISRIDRYEGFENLVLSDDAGSVGEVILENSGERVDQENGLSEDSGERDSEEQCFDVRDEGKGYEKNKMLKSVIAEVQKVDEELNGDDAITDEKEGNVGMANVESEELVKEEEDDWEGIERSEVEKVFAEAVNYVEYGGKGKGKEDDRLVKLSSDVQMQLYGLHKVAVEGPCADPQPMALKVSARVKCFLGGR